MIAVVHHPAYSLPTSQAAAGGGVGPGGDPRGKNAVVHDLLREQAGLRWYAAPVMPRRWIEAVHDPDYVAEVFEARVPRATERRIGFPVTAAVADRSRRVAGGTWEAARLAIAGAGFAANLAGGSHHALRETGAGYCVFNDLAIAAHRLVAEGQAARVLIVDVDVHQGDGTAQLTAANPAIATYSIHAEKNFPARKQYSTVDVALADGAGDAAYLQALTSTLPALVDRFLPDCILYQAGVDPHVEDRLGRLALTDKGLAARDGFVAGLVRARGVALASSLGGGYGRDIAVVAARHAATILTLGGFWSG